MSAPTIEYKHSKYLDYGFLAARAEQAAAKLAQGEGLSDSDKQMLDAGSEFLKQVASGASALTSGNYRVQNLTSAMEALEFAMDPLEQLGDALSDDDIGQVLSEAADAVTYSAHHPADQLSDASRARIDLFRHFFDEFYKFIRAQMSATSKAPILGGRSRFESLNVAHA
ncbi:hypothetical protein [Burkholderia glumae]|uniref:hypothetical protein n=1 Tax=Burkholderia glumae TaxID=337 RepID=UPI0020CEF6B6|nr:hypothetical protein [Burkholderia glumae]MCQ0033133.1 hypothetical protein [Burkholderia glumae]MCQ0038166.1 hypothetical protein [Burkholderia glumae]